MDDFIFKIIINPKTAVSKKSNVVIFSLRKYEIAAPKVLGEKFLSKIKRKQYSLIRQMIDIYRNEIITNFKG